MDKEPEICTICGKPKPPPDWSPWSTECDAGYTEMLDTGIRVSGYCDSLRLGLPWPPS